MRNGERAPFTGIDLLEELEGSKELEEPERGLLGQGYWRTGVGTEGEKEDWRSRRWREATERGAVE